MDQSDLTEWKCSACGLWLSTAYESHRHSATHATALRPTDPLRNHGDIKTGARVRLIRGVVAAMAGWAGVVTGIAKSGGMIAVQLDLVPESEYMVSRDNLDLVPVVQPNVPTPEGQQQRLTHNG